MKRLKSNRGFAFPTVLGTFVLVTGLVAGLFIMVMNMTVMVTSDSVRAEDEFEAMNRVQVATDYIYLNHHMLKDDFDELSGLIENLFGQDLLVNITEIEKDTAWEIKTQVRGMDNRYVRSTIRMMSSSTTDATDGSNIHFESVDDTLSTQGIILSTFPSGGGVSNLGSIGNNETLMIPSSQYLTAFNVDQHQNHRTLLVTEPHVLHIKGDFVINGNGTTLNGNFVIDGNLIIQGNNAHLIGTFYVKGSVCVNRTGNNLALGTQSRQTFLFIDGDVTFSNNKVDNNFSIIRSNNLVHTGSVGLASYDWENNNWVLPNFSENSNDGDGNNLVVSNPRMD